MSGFSHWKNNPGAFSTHYATPSMIDLEKLEKLLGNAIATSGKKTVNGHDDV